METRGDLFHHSYGRFSMTTQEQDVFREYLRSIEDELLVAVSADYIWLAVQTEDEQPESRFHWRRGACREEGRQEERRQGQEGRLRLRGHRVCPPRGRPDADAHLALVHRARGRLRHLSRRERADAGQGAEERAAAGSGAAAPFFATTRQ